MSGGHPVQLEIHCVPCCDENRRTGRSYHPDQYWPIKCAASFCVSEGAQEHPCPRCGRPYWRDGRSVADLPDDIYSVNRLVAGVSRGGFKGRYLRRLAQRQPEQP